MTPGDQELTVGSLYISRLSDRCRAVIIASDVMYQSKPGVKYVRILPDDKSEASASRVTCMVCMLQSSTFRLWYQRLA